MKKIILSLFFFWIVTAIYAQCKGEEQAAFVSKMQGLFHSTFSMYGPVKSEWKKDSTLKSGECKGEVLYRYRFTGELYGYPAEYTLYANKDTVQYLYVKIKNIDSTTSEDLNSRIVKDLGTLQYYASEIYIFSDCRSAYNSVYYYKTRKEWCLQYGSHKFNWCFSEF